jgi:hypothetical protein
MIKNSTVFLAIAWALFSIGCSERNSAPVSPDPILSSPGGSTEAAVADGGTHTYRVRIENLTTGQPLSPGVVVTHTKEVSVFHVGARASEGIRLIAENGEPAVAVSELTGRPGVHDVKTIDNPIHRIGGPGPTSVTLQISARANANRLSLATMLICTNDGFTGLDTVKLPGGFHPETHLSAGYDAGTEANNQRSDQIVDPCGAIGPLPLPMDGNGRVPTAAVITHHPNIQLLGDLVPALHGWHDPVARITIQRIH